MPIPGPICSFKLVNNTLCGIMPSYASMAALTPNPPTPPFSDDQEWITAYMLIHCMSNPSSRVAYLFCFVVAFVFFLASLVHCLSTRNTVLGAYWLKWALRRRTWRKKHSLAVAQRKGQSHRQPLSLPPNAQLLSLCFLLVVTLVLSFVGPDYIAPQVGVFDFVNNAPVARRSTYGVSQFLQYQYVYPFVDFLCSISLDPNTPFRKHGGQSEAEPVSSLSLCYLYVSLWLSRLLRLLSFPSHYLFRFTSTNSPPSIVGPEDSSGSSLQFM
jgi:hypothetical protein